MVYLDMQLAVNDKQYPEELKAWNEVYPLLGNPEEADILGFFWVQKQAKLKEISCVLWDGSNALTPAIKNTEADTITLENDEAEQSLQKQVDETSINEFLKRI